ncbi:MAG TPA: glycosyltransferase family 39 protein [Vicinamibacterales bacterium]|nr:glycosyltransferase family 39 protein [Vicinamibacterales bacterium]
MNAFAWLIPPFALAAGWLLWTRLPAGVDDSDDPLERGFASLLAGVLLAGFLSVLLAEAGMFRSAVVVAGLAAATLALWRLPRRAPAAARLRIPDAAALAAVAAMAIATLGPASEEVLGGRDEGVYTNIAAWVAEHGTLRVRSEALASVEPEAREVFQRRVLFPGFYIGDAAAGVIYPQFLHLHPIYMAMGFWLGGLPATLLVPPFYGLLAHLGMFFLMRRLLGTWPAVVASLLLATNMAQTWVLRTPFSEGAAQFTAIGTLWCAGRAASTSGLRWGVLGGLAMGAGFLARVDAILLLLAMIPALAIVHASSARPIAWATTAFLPIALASAVWSAVHGYVFTPPYMRAMDDYLVPAWAAAGVLLVLYWASLRWSSHTRALVDRVYEHGNRWWTFAALCVVLAFCFFLWIRPHFDPLTFLGLSRFASRTMQRVAGYFSTPGMVVACLGIVILLRRWLVNRRIEWVPFLAVFLTTSLAYFCNPHVSYDHPWAMRRFVPVIVPGIGVGIAAAVGWLWHGGPRRQAGGRAAALIVLGLVLALQARVLLPYWSFREKGGAIAQLETIARHIPRGALLLHTGGVEVWVATPLSFIRGYDSLPALRRIGPEADEAEMTDLFERQVRRWLDGGRQVYYLTDDVDNWPFLTDRLLWEPVAAFRFVTNWAGWHRRGIAAGPATRVDTLHLLRITKTPDVPPPCAGLTLDATQPVYGRARGWYGIEAVREERFRWSQPASQVHFATCDRRGPGRPTAVRVRARCTRARPGKPCSVHMSVNGTVNGTLHLTRDWEDHTLPVPAPAVADPEGAIRLRFAGPTFTPRGPVRDRRLLSFQVQMVALEGAPARPD